MRGQLPCSRIDCERAPAGSATGLARIVLRASGSFVRVGTGTGLEWIGLCARLDRVAREGYLIALALHPRCMSRSPNKTSAGETAARRQQQPHTRTSKDTCLRYSLRCNSEEKSVVAERDLMEGFVRLLLICSGSDLLVCRLTPPSTAENVHVGNNGVARSSGIGRGRLRGRIRR